MSNTNQPRKITISITKNNSLLKVINNNIFFDNETETQINLFQPISAPNNSGMNPPKILIVTAHPDDESVFFSPLLKLLRSLNYSIHLLCLSNGNFAGLGSIRETELIKSVSTYDISREQVKIINRHELQDNPYSFWPKDVVSNEIFDHIQEINPIAVFTFDGYGVSGHRNHISTYRGALDAFKRLKENNINIPFYTLQSVSLIRRFSCIFDLFITVFIGFIVNYLQICGMMNYYKEIIIGSLNNNSVLNAMKYHKSQLTFLMRLELLLSRYSYVNTFHEIE